MGCSTTSVGGGNHGWWFELAGMSVCSVLIFLDCSATTNQRLSLTLPHCLVASDDPQRLGRTECSHPAGPPDSRSGFRGDASVWVWIRLLHIEFQPNQSHDLGVLPLFLSIFESRLLGRDHHFQLTPGIRPVVHSLWERHRGSNTQKRRGGGLRQQDHHGATSFSLHRTWVGSLVVLGIMHAALASVD